MGNFKCLNRTSVGLKLAAALATRASKAPSLNRTSVGLKLVGDMLIGGERVLPQSNQRGIETRSRMAEIVRKNNRPQSNQRGIETRDIRERGRGARRASIEPAWD